MSRKMNIWKVIAALAAAAAVCALLYFILIRGNPFLYYGRKGGKRVVMGSFESFSFSYSTGNYMNARRSFEAELKDGKVKVKIALEEVADEDAAVIETGSEFMQKLEEAAETHGVRKWNGFSLSNKRVMDGTGFRLSIRMENDEYLTASGYMARPKGYREAASAFESIFMELYDSVYPDGMETSGSE